MQFVALAIALVCLVAFGRLSSAQDPPNPCLNLGTPILETNACECGEFYSGDICQDVHCDIASDADGCQDFFAQGLCEQSAPDSDEVRALCPFACNICPTPANPCLNYGTLVLETGACECGSFFTGATCNEIICDQAFDDVLCPVLSGSCDPTAEYSEAARAFCPMMCGICTCTRNADSCLNQGTFQSQTCSCACPLEYTGVLCEKQRCGHGGNPDPVNYTCYCSGVYKGPQCNDLDCTDASDQDGCQDFSHDDCRDFEPLNWLCPITCGTCACSRTCLHGGTRNDELCTCDCAAGYTGAACEICPPDDTYECPHYTVADCVDDTRIQGICPHVCGLCGTPVTTTTPQPCTELTCDNFGVFNHTSCVCDCVAGYSGNTCADVVPPPCSPDLVDLDACDSMTDPVNQCLIDPFRGACPIACNTCVL